MRKICAVCLIYILMFCIIFFFGQAKSYAVDKNTKVDIRSGLLTGKVSDMDKKPLPNISIKIIDFMGKVKYSALTDKQGTYAVKDILAGTYLLTIANKQKILLNVNQDAGTGKIYIMLPKSAPSYASGSISTLSTPLLVTIVGGVVLVGASFYGISKYDSGTYYPVSP